MSEDRVALVTGASRGIGAAIADGLLAMGMTVVLGMRQPEAARQPEAGRQEDASRQKDASRQAGKAVPMRLDVTDAATIAAAAAEIVERFGRLDVLVNNAGIGGPRVTPTNADAADVAAVFDTNVFGVVRVTNAMIGLLRRSGAGRIVNVSSGTGSLAWMSDPDHYFAKLPAAAAYPASKTALTALTVQYAKELKPEGILVNAAIPGACNTDFVRGLSRVITRTAKDGAAIAIKLATLGPDGPTGGAFDDDGAIPW